jgi:lipopolysaccharide/colanic/teichoic acid biosynthesis glycosyltransferase
MPTTLHLAAPAFRRERSAVESFSWLAVPEPLARRFLNVAIAGLGILLTLPVMLLIALAVRITSPGPIIYTQTRIGLDRRRHPRRDPLDDGEDVGGVPFRMYKFRTMRVADDDRQTWASQDGDRITPVGRILRKFRLDELPQLWNVLLGDMNVVGPRPEQPKIFARLRQQISAYAIRQRTRPGITGLAQVSQGYDRDLEDVRRKVAFDLTYLRRQSVAEDLRIMLRTIPVMLGRRGAV